MLKSDIDSIDHPSLLFGVLIGWSALHIDSKQTPFQRIGPSKLDDKESMTYTSEESPQFERRSAYLS